MALKVLVALCLALSFADVDAAAFSITVSPTTVTLDENIPAKNIANLTVANNGTKLTTFLIKGNPDGLFAIAADGKITTTKKIDFEKYPLFNLTITGSSGNSTSTIYLPITINDVNEKPVFSNKSPQFDVIDASAVGSVVGTVSATDIDIYTGLTYSLTGSTDFKYNDSTNSVVVAKIMNRTAVALYSLTLTATDNGTSPRALFDTATVNITVIVPPQSGGMALGTITALVLSFACVVVKQFI